MLFRSAALGSSIDIDFTKGESKHFFNLPGTVLKYTDQGAEFVIEKESNAPTIESNWNIFYGSVEVVMKAAHGQGIVSSFVLESSTLDEVDWEWIGSDYASVQSNYYGKGNTTTYDRAMYHPLANPQTGFHTYTVDWTPEYLAWSVDGAEIRRLLRGQANGGLNYPQTPMKVKLGNWVGGGSKSPEGTVQWAGGLADFTQAPFVMTVKSLKITDGHPGAKTYTYGDRSGSDASIIVDGKGGQVFQEQSSSEEVESSTSTKATSTKTSSVAVSTTTTVESSTATTMTTSSVKSTSTSSVKSTSDSSTKTATSTSTASESEETDAAEETESAEASATSAPATVQTGAAPITGANFAMIVAAGALSYLAL